MDKTALSKLNTAQAEQLNKSSTERLVAKLIKFGIDEEAAVNMTRPQLIEKNAELMLKPPEVLSPEAFKFKELELRQQELDFQRERLEHDRVAEAERIDREERRHADLMALKQNKLKQESQIAKEGRLLTERREGTITARTKKFGDALQHILPKMPSDISSLPVYFETVENIYKVYEVPDDLRAKLLLPLLSVRAKELIGRVTIEHLDKYDAVKRYLLNEFKLTPRELRSKFISTGKLSDETFTLFRARLRSLLLYYVRSREAEGDFDKLFDLMIADKLKDMLPTEALRYVLSLEGQGTFESSKVADLADIYASNYEGSRYRGMTPTTAENSDSNGGRNRKFNRFKKGPVYGKTGMAPQVPSTNWTTGGNTSTSAGNTGFSGSRDPRKCFICGGGDHLKYQCKHRNEQSNQSRVSGSAVHKSASATACLLQPINTVIDRVVGDVKSTTCETDIIDNADCNEILGESDQSEWIFAVAPLTDSLDADMPVDVVVTPLSSVDVVVEGELLLGLIDSGCQLPLINKSLVKTFKERPCGKMLHLQTVTGDTVSAELITLHIRLADNDSDTLLLDHSVPMTFGMLKSMVKGYDVILPAQVVTDLQAMSEASCVNKCIVSDTSSQSNSDTVKATVLIGGCKNNAKCKAGVNTIVVDNDDELLNFDDFRGLSDDVSVDNVASSTVDVMCVSNGSAAIMDDSSSIVKVNVSASCDSVVDDTKARDPPVHKGKLASLTTEVLAKEQLDDPSLINCFRFANVGKCGFYVDNGLLYHHDELLGHKVEQLCIPSNRREQVMELAHSSVFGGHLASKKTGQRIKLSFFWPTLRADVCKYCESCTGCQLRKPLKTLDRVPITPIVRAGLPFECISMDCIGPIEPPSAQGHKYCLCIVDSCTRFPFVFALKSLTAKVVCDALLEMFAVTGISKVITSDRGSNFTAQLTQEFLSRLGCSPRLNSPLHPQAAGMVERFNQTYKNMLHHVIRENPRQWHKAVPYLVWALREVPNATTGQSPYLLVYGRQPRGPLTILKETWEGNRELPPSLGTSAVQYLQQLKENLEIALDKAQVYSKEAQSQYARYYNTRSRDKHFKVNDKVVILLPDTTHSKLYSRWQGPATIKRVRSPYSYDIDMGDGSVRHLHANRIRPFIERVETVAVSMVSDGDSDFGHIRFAPIQPKPQDLPSQRIDKERLKHLTGDQQGDLLALLDKYADCFSDKPGLCNVVEHEINLMPGFVPKRSRAYRIPEMLKNEVDRQIDDLLQQGLITPSKSPVASPIVCVRKKNGEVRLTCDYRYVNSFTRSDAYPMPNLDEVKMTVGRGKFISVFDAKAGYWQLPVRSCDQYLTAFVTHSGLWEWRRMPFGLKTSGNSFVRAVNMILQPVKDFCASYVDDLAVYSDRWDDHMTHVDKFLTEIRKSGLTLNLSKCDFAMPEVKYVGCYVGSGKHRPDPERLAAIQNMNPPTTKKQLRQVLGLFGWYRTYIDNFAGIAKPLTDLTKAKVPNDIPWPEQANKAFDCLRRKLCEAPTLHVPQMGQPFILQTDASATAVGVCLGQGSVLHPAPCAFSSQKLSATQSKWSAIEREAYAVIWALQKYKDTIFGAHIIVISDHNPLRYIVECAPKSAKLTRWALALQEYDLELRYTRGRDNAAADCLSRPW
jgi:hypothetical protein